MMNEYILKHTLSTTGESHGNVNQNHDAMLDKTTTVSYNKEEFINFLYGDPHPARVMDFDVLLDGLKDAVTNKKTVVAKQDPVKSQLTIYNYVPGNKTWGIFECLARGLVLDVPNRQVVATPFPKFFNYGEIIPKKIPTLTQENQQQQAFEVCEKMDGSLGIAFYYDEEWYVATRGSITQSPQSVWATKWFRSHVSPKLLDEGGLGIDDNYYLGSTLLFEIIYPENRIVINYGNFSGLVLLGAYHRNGKEYARSELQHFADQTDVRLVEQYDQFNSVSDVVKVAKTLPSNQEGWVLRLHGTGYRLKIKGEEYCMLHKSKSMCTPIGIWSKMKSNHDGSDESLMMKNFENSLPEEHVRDYRKIKSVLEHLLEERMETVKIAIEASKHLSLKEVGILFSKTKTNKKGTIDDTIEIPCAADGTSSITIVPGWTRPFIISAKREPDFQHGDISQIIHPQSTSRGNNSHKTAQRLRDKLFDTFRPVNNTLPGYIPSDVENRFLEL